MTDKINPRPNIAQLEDLVNQTDEGEIEIKPDGSVVRLTPIELTAKNLRLEQERNVVLRSEINRLREILKQIGKLAAD